MNLLGRKWLTRNTLLLKRMHASVFFPRYSFLHNSLLSIYFLSRNVKVNSSAMQPNEGKQTALVSNCRLSHQGIIIRKEKCRRYVIFRLLELLNY